MKNYCPNCGNPFDEDDKFCSQCAQANPHAKKEITQNKSIEENSSKHTAEEPKGASVSQEVVNQKTSDPKADISVDLGYAALICCLIIFYNYYLPLNICGILLSILGLVKASMASPTASQRNLGLGLNIIALSFCVAGLFMTIYLNHFAN